MSRTNIVIDGNYLFYKTLFSFDGFRAKNGIILDDEQSTARFIRKVATDFVYSLQTFDNYSRIILTVDSSSWRKTIEIDDAGYAGYKGTRSSSFEINWESFYESYKEFTDIVQNFGVVVSRIHGAEGDDLMYLWSRHLMQNGEDSIILTGDKDLYQIVKTDGSNYSVIYNTNSKTRGIIAPLDFQEWVKNQTKPKSIKDAFSADLSSFMGGGSIDLIGAALAKTSITEIDPNAIALNKILCGDDGDNVPSVYIWQKDGKQKRITNKDYKKVHVKLMETHGDISIDSILISSKYRGLIHRTLQDSAKIEINRDVFEKNIHRNLQFVWLSEKVIPSEIVEEFQIRTDPSYHPHPIRSFDKVSLLEDTKYAKVDVGIESDIFKLL